MVPVVGTLRPSPARTGFRSTCCWRPRTGTPAEWTGRRQSAPRSAPRAERRPARSAPARRSEPGRAGTRRPDEAGPTRRSRRRRGARRAPRRRPAAAVARRRQRNRHWGGAASSPLLALAAHRLSRCTRSTRPSSRSTATAPAPSGSTIPAGADAGQIGELLEAKGVVDRRRFFELNATITGRRGELRPGNYTLQKGMSNGDAIEALTKGPKVKVVADGQRHDRPRARRSARRRRSSTRRRSRAATSRPRARPRRCKRDPQARRARRAPRPPRASCSRPPTRCSRARRPTTSSSKQLDAFEENFGSVDMRYAKQQEPHALRRADHRLDDRARGAARPRSARSSPR